MATEHAWQDLLKQALELRNDLLEDESPWESQGDVQEAFLSFVEDVIPILVNTHHQQQTNRDARDTVEQALAYAKEQRAYTLAIMTAILNAPHIPAIRYGDENGAIAQAESMLIEVEQRQK